MDMNKVSRWKALCLSFIICNLSLNTAHAQTQLSQYQPGVTPEGAVYMLPMTAVRLHVLVEKTTYQPGDFARYAQRYLRLNNVSQEPSVGYRVVSVTPEAVGVPDTTKAYSVKFNAKTAAANLSLSDEGVLLAINADAREVKQHRPFVPARKQPTLNPRQFMNEDILTAGSTAKMAELTAREIYDLRENRSLLIKGQADFMPSDGAQMQLMLNQIDQQDRALSQLFQGTAVCDTTEHVFTIVPTEAKRDSVVFRLSQRLGVLEADDLAGVPYYINVEDISNLPAMDEEAAAKARKKQVQSGIYVNVPGKMRISVSKNGGNIATTEMPAPQFGYVELLSGDLFNKHYATHLWLNPVSGAVEKLEAEQPK
jgi:hypothetical protein